MYTILITLEVFSDWSCPALRDLLNRKVSTVGLGGKSKKQKWEQWLGNLHLMRKTHGGRGKATFSDLKG